MLTDSDGLPLNSRFYPMLKPKWIRDIEARQRFDAKLKAQREPVRRPMAEYADDPLIRKLDRGLERLVG